VTYRAAPVSQRDGSALANSNCRCASIATGLDYQTLGGRTSTGSKMRSYMDDQSGGTDSGDAAQAWSRGYGQDLRVRDGYSFDDALADLRDGRLVHLDVWHSAAGGPCLSGSGGYGHSMAVAPERNGSDWLVADPWCSPGKWVWWPESKLRAGAEKWGSQVYTQAVAGVPGPIDEDELRRLMVLAALALMRRWRPGREAPEDPPDTGGSGGRIMYTTTKAQAAGGGDDMAITAASGMTTNYVCRLGQGRDFFADANLTERLGELSKDATAVYIGAAIGETVEGGSRAVLLNTGTPYQDKVARPTIVYVVADACWGGGPEPVPPAPPTDVEAALAERDQDWRDWLLDGSPGQDG
jgi:hypothetical protein